ncbi:DUF4258 domain-containing protein [Crocosphaera chwakensis]|uniref:Uncharacterized protein n=1 Tax=Crocosphaera chwakensis CCY0110 TaxID=391612 RepID=A3IKB4_9CHRO|nr:DUF4258 domain-containing protein [Crocosphaera chwakensis]EAZ93103.1 hypothetical protein CY0110_03504 [Crocosphaera chwakensis CCY0110]
MKSSYELTEHAKKRLDERSIPEFGNRVLRVVYKPTENPIKVITVHFDRSMKGKL